MGNGAPPERREADELASSPPASAPSAPPGPANEAVLAEIARLHELTDRLEVVLQGVADAVSVQNGEGRMVYANLAAARFCGFDSVEELLSAGIDGLRTRFMLYDEAGQRFGLERLPNRQALRGAPSALFPARLHDIASGRDRWIEMRSSPVRGADGSIDLVVNIWHDVTERRKREEATRVHGRVMAALQELRNPDETLAAVAAALVPDVADWCTVDLFEDGKLRPVALAHQDPEKVLLAREVQRRYPPVFDAERGLGRVVTTGVPELAPVIPPEVLRESALDAEHARILEELGLRSAMVVPLRAHDRVFGTITLIAAESGRRYDEGDLALAVELGQRAGIAVDNARLYQEAQAASRLRDAFLAVAGHELRTPLTALGLQLQSLANALDAGTFEPQLERWKARVGKTVTQVRRLDKLVNELLDVSRISSGRSILDREDFDLAALVHEVVDRHADDADRSRTRVDVEVEGDVRGRWDKGRLDQVVTNLLGNALKYGEGRPVRVRVVGDGDRVRLTVHDTGIGIEAAAHARIFGRFERAVSERHYAGLGLGLWIVRELVEAHAGAVSFESAPGVGSTFTVVLPRVPPET